MSTTVGFRKTNQVTIFGAGIVSPNYHVQVTGEISEGSTQKSFVFKGEKTASLVADDNSSSVNHASAADGTITLKFQYSDDGGKTWKDSTLGTHVKHPDSPKESDIVTDVVPESGDANHRASITIVQMPLIKY